MANEVRIHSIGAPPLTARDDPGGQAAVEYMKEYWRAHLERAFCDRPDVIVLPECCDRYEGQDLAREQAYYRQRGNQLRDLFADAARTHQCHIAYAAIREVEDGTWRNSIQWLDRHGEVAGVYNKNHVVIEENTEHGILGGRHAPLINCDFGTVACAICFDLNFDELRQKYVSQHPDLIVFASMYHGGLMQSYWAYSCRAHFVSCLAPVGTPSAVLAPTGEVLASSTNYFESVSAVVNLDCALAHLDGNWEKLAALRARYGRDVDVHDPGLLGSVLIRSQHCQVSAASMVAEFDIELLDPYLARALEHQHRTREP